jgi:succinate dehydrogenase/fumarate reductase flavoprotein subunit
MDSQKSQKGFSRRGFIKGAAIGIGAAVAGVGLKEASAVLPPKKWTMETDIVIVGFGGAGATAAMEAHDAGAKVLVLEKAPSNLPGGNTGCCAGYILPPSNAEDGFKYYKALGSGTVTDDELIRTFVKALMGVPDWLKKLGVPVEVIAPERPGAFPKLPGAKVDYVRVVGGGVEAFKILLKETQARKIKIMYETPVKRLIQNPGSGAVLGVVAESKGKSIFIKAKRGVILACGGYENNMEMQSNFNFPGLKFYPWGTPYNTGDGLLMSMAAGAKIWHLPSLELMSYTIKAATDQLGCSIPVGSFPNSGSFIYVNKYGKRFTEENKRLAHYKGPVEVTFYDHERAEYSNIPFFMIFDETYKKQGPLVPKNYLPGQVSGWAVVQKIVEDWSADNSKEIDKGWIKKADTIANLAKAVGISPEGLSATISSYNEYQGKGQDPEFGRAAKTLLPIHTPPYYAMELGLCVINTQGGPTHDAESRVLDIDNKPIPRLYAAGELGSFFGHLYQGGNNFPEALAFGRIAGKNAAKLTPWKS